MTAFPWALSAPVGGTLAQHVYGVTTSITGAPKPGTPVGVSAALGAAAGQVTVSFTPTQPFGPSTKYLVSEAKPNAGAHQALVTSSPATIAGLTAGASYTFTVTASDVGGTSAPSAPSPPITLPAQIVGPVGADIRGCDGRQRAGDRDLGGADQRRRQPDHQLHGHARGRHAGGHPGHRDVVRLPGPHQRGRRTSSRSPRPTTPT